ncbi:MAG: efflux RND transporter periplasmic adaptor subunit [Candidatus Binataceae bacterium]
MASEQTRGPSVRELEALRIQRAPEVKKRTRALAAAIGALVLASLGVGGWIAYSRTLGRPPEVKTVAVTLKSAGQAGVLLTGSGYVVTKHKYIVIGTKILGQIMAEPIEEGQVVKRGDLLARIDDRDYQAQLDQAKASRDLAAANVRLKYAQAQRLRQLYRERVSSRDELDKAENELAVARAELRRADAAIQYAKFNVEQCTIRSPINGIVLKKYREMGDTINFGGSIQAGGGTTDIVQLADTEDMRVEVDINQSDIAKIAIGTPATITPDAHADRAFEASVVKIYPAADRQKGTVKIEAKITEADLKIIKPEMSAKVTFLATATQKQEPPMVLVVKKAVMDDAASPTVWVVRNGTATRVSVSLGREFQDGVEIKSGLTGGELVIIEPPANLKDGQPVTAVPA